MRIFVSACLLGENCKYYGGNKYSEKTVAFIKGHEVVTLCREVAVLQSRSPSCGVKEIYDGSFSGRKVKGQEIFAKMLMEQGIKVINVEEIEKCTMDECDFDYNKIFLHK